MTTKPDTKHALCECCGHPIGEHYDVEQWETKALIMCPTQDRFACIERGSRRMVERAARYGQPIISAVQSA